MPKINLIPIFSIKKYSHQFDCKNTKSFLQQVPAYNGHFWWSHECPVKGMFHCITNYTNFGEGDVRPLCPLATAHTKLLICPSSVDRTRHCNETWTCGIWKSVSYTVRTGKKIIETYLYLKGFLNLNQCNRDVTRGSPWGPDPPTPKCHWRHTYILYQ